MLFALGPMLILLAVLDISAFSLVIGAGHFANPVCGNVTFSNFRVVVIISGSFFLKERLVTLEWGAVGAVFGGVAFLGF